MLLWNCLWIGALAGVVASRLMRGAAGGLPLGGSVAVGVLGALLGGLAGSRVEAFPHVDLVLAGVGAALMLVAWSTVRSIAAGHGTRERAGTAGQERSAARRG
jgi:uncharacterized membrane protein YeaQ/YmgE (transglycosylase-associated protein family)